MNIQPIMEKSINVACQAVGSGKQAVLWAGYHVRAGYCQHISPAVQRLYSLGMTTLASFGRLVQKGPNLMFGVAAALFISGIAAFKIADRKAYEDNPVSQALWKTAGIASFLAATTVTSMGIGMMLTA